MGSANNLALSKRLDFLICSNQLTYTLKMSSTEVKAETTAADNGPKASRGRGGPRGGRGDMRGGGPMRSDRGRGGSHPYENRGGRGGPRGGGRGGFNRQSSDREMRGPDGPRGGPPGGPGGRFDRIIDRLSQIQGPTHDLAPLDTAEKKFSGRARIYIGNFSNELSEESLKEKVSANGEVGEMFFNREKNFAFVRMSTRFEAEKVKRDLDGKMVNGRALKVRFSPHQGAVKVSNLGPWVSNELLHRSFSIFGEIERCCVAIDERGRSKGEAIVEFEKKPCALECVKRCSDGCFFLTASLRPVIAEIQDEAEDDDGCQEKMLPKRNHEYQSEREIGPRFANPGSFEFEYGSKWKALYDMKKQKLEALDREMKLEEDKLVAQMEYARYEHETESLRNQLRQRESARDMQKSRWEQREQEMDVMMKNEAERRVREEKDMMQRMEEQEQSMRRRQEENSLFMQAQELNQMLDVQDGPGGMGGGRNDSFGGGNGGWGGDSRNNSFDGGRNDRYNDNGPFGNSFGDGGFDGPGPRGGGGYRGGPRGGSRGRGGWGGNRGGGMGMEAPWSRR